MTLTYHRGRAIGKSAFSFDSADPPALEEAKPYLRDILESTVQVLGAVSRILQAEPLSCDDFRMVPDADSLWPLFELLIAYPTLIEEDGSGLASIALRLMLAGLKEDELLDLTQAVADSTSLKVALDKLEKSDELAVDHGTVKAGIDDALAITSRYTMMLYWLLRSRHAADFSYSANAPRLMARVQADYGSPKELPVSSGAAYAKHRSKAASSRQHLVPYAHLRKAFGLEGSRPGRDVVHNIGNITYISVLMNSWDQPGDKPLKLDSEREQNPNNLAAHMLEHVTILDEFRRATEMPQDSDSIKDHFGLFSAHRRKALTVAFLDWEQTVRKASVVWESAVPDIWPAPRLIRPRRTDIVRTLDYPPRVKQLLLALSAMSKLQDTLGGRTTMRVRRKLANGRHATFALLHLRRDGKSMSVVFVDAKFRKTNGLASEEVELTKPDRMEATLTLVQGHLVRVGGPS
jgi:hypothetical protein